MDGTRSQRSALAGLVPLFVCFGVYLTTVSGQNPSPKPPPYTLTLADKYIIPDSIRKDTAFLQVRRSRRPTCTLTSDPRCLEVVVAPEHNLTVHVDFLVDDDHRRRLKGCLEQNETIVTMRCRKHPHSGMKCRDEEITSVMANDGQTLRRRSRESKPAVTCGLDFRSTSDQFGQVYVRDDFCPKNVTHACTIRITIRQGQVKSVHHTRLEVYDRNESPVCPAMQTVDRPMVWVPIACRDRDRELMTHCGAPGCRSYTQNVYRFKQETTNMQLRRRPPSVRVLSDMRDNDVKVISVWPQAEYKKRRPATTHISVKYDADDGLRLQPILRIRSVGSTVAYEGDTVTLECWSDQPSTTSCSYVKWVRNQETFVSDSPRLHFESLTLEDAGEYSCLSKVGRMFSRIEIEVYPRGGPMHKDVHETDGLTVKVNTPSQLSPQDIKILNAYIQELLRKALNGFYHNMEELSVNVTRESFQDGSYSYSASLVQRLPRHEVDYVTLKNKLPAGFWPLHVLPLTFQQTAARAFPVFEFINWGLIEGQRLDLTFEFRILYGPSSPRYRVSWQFQGRNLSRSTLGVFQTAMEESEEFSHVLNLRLRTVKAMLSIPILTEAFAGEYRCHLHMPQPDGQDKETAIKVLSNFRSMPRVRMWPLKVTVPAGSPVSYTCDFENPNAIRIFINGDVTWGQDFIEMSGVLSYSSTLRVKSGTVNVTCISRAITELTSYTARAQLTIQASQGLHKETGVNTTCQLHTDPRGVTWMSSPANTVIKASCPSGFTGTAKKVCSDDGQWLPGDYHLCERNSLLQVAIKVRIMESLQQPSAEDIETVASDLSKAVDVESQSIESSDIRQTVDILSDFETVISEAETVSPAQKGVSLVTPTSLESVANVTDILLSANASAWQETNRNEETLASKKVRKFNVPARRLVLAVDKMVASSLKNQTMTSQPIVKSHVAIKREQISAREDIRFPAEEEAAYQGDGGWVLESPYQAFLSHRVFSDYQDNVTYGVVLYKGINDKMRLGLGDEASETSEPVCNALYGKQVMTDILSFSLSVDIPHLSPPLNLTFPVAKNASAPTCGFLRTVTGAWSDEGCQTVFLDDDVIECHCDHMTNFAVLMSPTGTDPSSLHHQVLSVISIVGCSLSIACLVITILAHVIFWRHTKSDRAVLHLNLSVALILVYIVFMAGIDQICNQSLCTAITAMLHYLLLVVFFIMLAELIEVHMSISVVFSKKSALGKLLLTSYLLPALIVSISLSATQAQGYTSQQYCWLSVDTGTIWAFVGPALVIILINVVQAVLVMRTMMTIALVKRRDATDKAKVMVRAIMVLSPLMGVTWLFGILAVNSDTMAFQYLFALCDSLQGVAIFIFYCLLSRQVQVRFMLSYRRLRARLGDSTKSSGSWSAERREMAAGARDG